MRIFASLTAAALAALLAVPASAGGEVKLYPYATHVNYCPPGLQPIVLGGVICCGQPNTHMSWQQVMKHPVRTHYVSHACRPGEKGCAQPASACEAGEKGC